MIRSLCITALVVAFSHAAIADDAVDHYNPAAPVSVQQAEKNLTEGIEVVGKTLKKKSLNYNDLEAIHEVSYSMEDAAEYISIYDKHANPSTIYAIIQAVESLHQASEHHGEHATRVAYDQLLSFIN